METAALTFRQDYYADPKGWQALVDLLQDIFGIDVGVQMSMGGYDRSCMPFGWFDAGGQLVANFSAFAMPMVIDGVSVNAVGLQSGAVRPAYRGRGLYRDVMTRAFDWADRQGFEMGLLLTDKPELYTRYGFRTVPQHAFTGTFTTGDVQSQMRHLSVADGEDMALIRQRLGTRRPVSDVFAVARQSEMFLLNAVFDTSIRLSLFEDRDCIVAWKQDGTEFRLLDIVSTQQQDIGMMVASLAPDARTMTVCFPPDRLNAKLTAQPYNGYCALMVRDGGRHAFDRPLILSPMAEF
jgi:predicted N-acetyltransferase YhbS